ncbi:MAG: acyl-CoA dehydrogenase family protein, partial [Acidimicrobiales bacterium]
MVMTNAVLEAVRKIGPSIAAQSDEIERGRGLPLDVVEMITPTGAFRMFVPEDLKGPEVEAWDGLEALRELAYHDGAAGWCAMIGSTTSLMSSSLPDPYAEEIFGCTDSITGGFAMPAGRARPVEGGLEVTGRWSWGSGTRHSTWVGGGCMIVGPDGKPT